MNSDFLKNFTSATTLIEEARRLEIPLVSIGYKDLIPVLKKGGTIINLSDYGVTNGTHWTAVWKDHETEEIVYFDSFGFPAPLEIIDLMKGDYYVYSPYHIQDEASGGCGNYVIQFIESMHYKKGNVEDRFKTFIQNFDLTNPENNRDIVDVLAFNDLKTIKK